MKMIKHIYSFIPISIMCLLIYGCTDHWEEARSKNTFKAYKEFVDRYRGHEKANEANSIMDSLRFNHAKKLGAVSAYESFLDLYRDSQFADEIRRELEKFESIMVNIQQSSNFEEDEFLPFHFERDAKTIIRSAGVRVAGKDANEYIATIEINANGEALSAYYEGRRYQGQETVGRISGTHYSGARITGILILEKKGKTIFKGRFSNESKPPVTINRLYEKPGDAPFGLIYDGLKIDRLICRAIAAGFGSEFLLFVLRGEGQEAAIEVLDEINPDWRESEATKKFVMELVESFKIEDRTDIGAPPYLSVRALAEIRDPRTVETLISLLKDENVDIRREAAKAVGKFKDQRAVPALIKLLEDELSRWYAIKALGEIGGIEAENALRNKIIGKDGFVNSEVKDALDKILKTQVISEIRNRITDSLFVFESLWKVEDEGTTDGTSPGVCFLTGDLAVYIVGPYFRNNELEYKIIKLKSNANLKFEADFAKLYWAVPIGAYEEVKISEPVQFENFTFTFIESKFANSKEKIFDLVFSKPDSNPVTSSSSETGAVTDIDGNVYQTIKIGDQWWMAENLKVTRYRNGDAVPNVIDNKEWSNLATGAYCNYDNNADNPAIYGRLYNWYAVNDSRNIAPEGWHVPSDAEWGTLIDYLGRRAGGKMKETGTIHWSSPNEGATNESGFLALPGGFRNHNSHYSNVGNDADFWSATQYLSSSAWERALIYGSFEVHRVFYGKQRGCSVRCVRD